MEDKRLDAAIQAFLKGEKRFFFKLEGIVSIFFQ